MRHYAVIPARGRYAPTATVRALRSGLTLGPLVAFCAKLNAGRARAAYRVVELAKPLAGRDRAVGIGIEADRMIDA